MDSTAVEIVTVAHLGTLGPRDLGTLYLFATENVPQRYPPRTICTITAKCSAAPTIVRAWKISW